MSEPPPDPFTFRSIGGLITTTKDGRPEVEMQMIARLEAVSSQLIKKCAEHLPRMCKIRALECRIKPLPEATETLASAALCTFMGIKQDV